MNQATQISLTVTLDQANVILASLSKQPFEAVADLINVIRAQAMEQLNPPSAQQELDGMGGTD